MGKKIEFSVQMLNKEAFVEDSPLSEEQIEAVMKKLECKYGGTVEIRQAVCYLPILTKNGD